MTNELCYLSATDALRRFRNGTLSPVDLIDAVLDAAQRQQATVNAATRILAEPAREQAHAAAARYRAGNARPLEGIPVIVKEETAVAGWPTTLGSEAIAAQVPARNHPIIDKLLDAGAILHLQSTTPEFCCLGQTWSRRWGVTRNPWNLAYTCGGSSGGSGAALAAGCGPLATGSDMGGSTRIPAALQGLYGYKPPFGRVPTAAGDELFAFAAEGPLARTFDDLVLMQNVISGPHPSNYAALPHQPLPTTYGDLTGWKIGYSRTLGSAAVCPDVRANLDAAVARLAQCGADIVDVQLDWDLEALAHTLMEGIFGIYFADYLRALPDDTYPRLTSYLQQLWDRYRDRANSVSGAAGLASALHQELQAKAWGLGCRALVCPTTFTTAVPAAMDPTVEPRLEIDGSAVDSYLGWVGTPPFNLLNRYPALTVPTGRARTGVPTAMQIVAPPYQDEAAFQVAANHARLDDSGLFKTVFPDGRADALA